MSLEMEQFYILKRIRSVTNCKAFIANVQSSRYRSQGRQKKHVFGSSEGRRGGGCLLLLARWLSRYYDENLKHNGPAV